MKWATRDFIHVDRVAAPWLIKRFIDQDAQFEFVSWEDAQQLPDDVIPFAIPGAELSAHDDGETTFQKLLSRYDLNDDPGLRAIARTVESVIAYVLEKRTPSPNDEIGQIGVGLMAIAEGILINSKDDASVLASSVPVYDALYTYFTTKRLFCERNVEHPPEDGKGPTNMILLMRELMHEHSAVKRSELTI